VKTACASLEALRSKDMGIAEFLVKRSNWLR
jgi:hypothetical protein